MFDIEKIRMAITLNSNFQGYESGRQKWITEKSTGLFEISQMFLQIFEGY